jgi:hypothetical protein
MIIKTWACLNRHCVNVFDSTAGDYPPCPRCGGIRVKWMPRALNIKSEKTAMTDRDVRDLQKVYGDRNFNSPRRGESAAPKVNPVTTPGKTMRYAPAGVQGWAAEVPIDRNGNPVAYCATSGVTSKISAAIGQRVSASRLGGKTLGVGANIEKAWRPPGGIPR